MNDSPADLIRDPQELRRRLAERTLDIRTLDLAGFSQWLDLQMARWQSDPVFVQRARIRDLRRAHPELRALEASWQRATRANAVSASGARMAVLGRKLHNVDRAFAGLDAALTEAPPERQVGLAAKRADFLAQRLRLEEEQDELIQSSAEQQDLLRLAGDLRRSWEAIGLDREMVRLADLLKDRGRGSGRAGTDFERDALAISRRFILPELGADGLHILRGVRLGAAGVELDLAVVRRTGGPDQPVEVLAVIEVKRNINDVAHGFLRRQIDLAWLTGTESAYDPAEHRTRQFATGHFDRPAVHWQDAAAFRFGPDSFRRFARDADTGYFLAGLYLVTRAGPVWGVPGAAQARISARIATDEDWDPADEAYLGRFFEWCRSLAGPVETPDVLRLYTETAERAKQLLIVEGEMGR